MPFGLSLCERGGVGQEFPGQRFNVHLGQVAKKIPFFTFTCTNGLHIPQVPKIPYMASTLSSQDLAFIAERGSDAASVETQIQYFKTGFPFLNIHKAATIGDGMIRLEEEQVDGAAAAFEAQLANLKVVKFVPASGAASRMFKHLFSFVTDNTGKPAADQQAALAADKLTRQVIEELGKFAFHHDLAATFSGTSLQETLAMGDYAKVLAHLLEAEGLGYGELPKGLLKFHNYTDGARTPMEEHLVEAVHYAGVKGGTASLHFTVSPEHRSRFEALVKEVSGKYADQFGVTFDISFSEQKPSTDTIAVDMDNEPFREEDGSLLFRPGGHGALIENLNDISADVIFIKNIDNVVPDSIKAETYRYKKALAGVLLDFQSQIWEYLEQVEEADEEILDEIDTFLQEELCITPPENFYDLSFEDKLTYVTGKLDRPLRVCGMVKNEGEPGGGPFWAQNPDGSVSLQVAESAQIDMDDPTQARLMKEATHFNPVDLVCATKDHRGNAYHLPDFRDPETGFISFKSKDGRDLKAQELPGLWNGAMSDWNTIFVEVPIITFNPVKTVNDLLREQHQ